MTWLGHNGLRCLCYCKDNTILEGVVAQHYISHSFTFLVLVATLSEHINIEFCPPHFFTDKQMVWIRYQPVTNGNEIRVLRIWYSFYVVYKILRIRTDIKEIGFDKNLPDLCYKNIHIWTNSLSHLAHNKAIARSCANLRYCEKMEICLTF